MKSVKLITAILLLSLFVLPSFTPAKTVKKAAIDMTVYVWFTPYGDYLDLNTFDDEVNLTGYDGWNYPPYTQQERGYQQCYCYQDAWGIWHLSANYYPQYRLYSHP